MEMKNVYPALVASLLISMVLALPTFALSDYNMSEREYREAELDNMQTQGDMQEYELESKIAAVEEQEAKEKAEADEANKQLLVYVAIGAVGLFAIFLINHQFQKPKPRK